MITMNISLPDGLKAFVDERVQTEGCGTSSEYVRDQPQHFSISEMSIFNGILGSQRCPMEITLNLPDELARRATVATHP